jgi:hypothetical protein
MRLSSAIAAGIGVGLAILALIVLRKQEPAASQGDETPELAAVAAGPGGPGGSGDTAGR